MCDVGFRNRKNHRIIIIILIRAVHKLQLVKLCGGLECDIALDGLSDSDLLIEMRKGLLPGKEQFFLYRLSGTNKKAFRNLKILQYLVRFSLILR